MGCRDQENTWLRFEFHNGAWGCTSGMELMFVAPTERILHSGIKEFASDDGSWIVTFEPKSQRWFATRD
jgi:hypothetical protein